MLPGMLFSSHLLDFGYSLRSLCSDRITTLNLELLKERKQLLLNLAQSQRGANQLVQANLLTLLRQVWSYRRCGQSHQIGTPSQLAFLAVKPRIYVSTGLESTGVLHV